MALAEIHPERVSDMYRLHTHTHTHSACIYILIDIDIDIDRQIVSIFLVFQAVDSINQARFAMAFAAFQLLLPGRGALNTNQSCMTVNREAFRKRMEKQTEREITVFTSN